MTKRKELHTGIGGNGATVWMVVTVRALDGSWRHVERFDNEAEARAWLKYA